MTRRRPPWEPNPETILEDLMALDRRVKFPGEPLPVWMVEAMRAGYRRWRQERKAKAAERSIARQRAREAEQKARGTIADRMLAVMQPGQWHGRGDVIAAADIEPGSGKWKMRELLIAGLVERAANPAWTPEIINPWRIMAGEAPHEPRWLFRLTAAGERRRAAWARERSEFERAAAEQELVG